MAVIAVAALAGYSSGFKGSFVFDDRSAIIENAVIKNADSPEFLWRTPFNTTLSGRPVAQWTVAFNYALNGLKPFGYHVVNLLIHISCALIIFLFIRNAAAHVKPDTARDAGMFLPGFLTALWWVVHPLTTQAVTYVIQRVESLAALFYVLTLYCVQRSRGSRHRALWTGLSAVSCWLGTGVKEITATAPVAAVIYDRVFGFESLAAQFKRRWKLYAGLSFSWVLLAALVFSGTQREASACSPLSGAEWLRLQAEVIAHYLKLVYYPAGQVFDYYTWPIPRINAALLAKAGGLALAVLACIAGIVRRRWYGFAGAVFFLVLAPTSSVLPLIDEAAEYRMYLPLAVVIFLTVAAGRGIMSFQFLRRNPALRVFAGSALLIVFVAVVSIHGYLTWQRNKVYHSPETLWRDTVVKRPANARAHMNLGEYLLKNGRRDEGIVCLEKALEAGYRPGLQAAARFNLANHYFDDGNLEKALAHYTGAIQCDPCMGRAYANRALVFLEKRKPLEAAQDQAKALELVQNDPLLHIQYAYTLLALGRKNEAVSQVRAARQAGGRPPADLVRRLRSSGKY